MKAYLDIETDRKGNLSVIGIFLEQGKFTQLYGMDITTWNVETILKKATVVVTFNGDRFDLPVIKRHLNLDVRATHHSLDLFNVKKQLGIKGGLKELERLFGIARRTEGLNGYDAMLLWEKYNKINKIDKHERFNALNLLLEYNKEDVINLVALEKALFKQMVQKYLW
jgi:uncharacterized protein YprB with RNaseH-like and TPR domain